MSNAALSSLLTKTRITDSEGLLPLGLRRGAGGGINPALKATILKMQAAAVTFNGNNPVELPDMATPPTISYLAAPDPTLTVHANYGLNPSQISVSPGRKYVRNAGAGQNRLYLSGPNVSPSSGDLVNIGTLTGFNPNLPNAGENSTVFKVGIKTASPVVEFQIPVPGTASPPVPYRLIVDGQYAARAGFVPNVGAAQGLGVTTVTFPTSQLRTIFLEIQYGNGPLLNISVQTGYTIVAAPSPALLSMTMGDSQIEGQSHGTNADGSTYYWAFDNHMNQFASMLGAQIANDALGGTGFVTRGSASDRNNVLQMVPYVVHDATWDYINLAVSQNDGAQWQSNPAGVISNFLATIAALRSAHPQAVIFVHGAYWGGAGIGPTLVLMESALFAQAAALNDPGVITIPRQSKVGGAPIVGTGWVGATTGTGNSDTCISSDGTHMTLSGQGVLAASDIAIARAKLAAFTF